MSDRPTLRERLQAAHQAGLRALAANGRAHARDALGLGGVAMVVKAAALWAEPLGWLVAGAFALAAAALLSVGPKAS